MLEPDIAAIATEMRSEEQAEEVLRLCQETEDLYRSGEDHTSKDIEFHSCIARCSGNMVVQTLVPIIQSAVTTFCYVTNRSLMNETISTHRAIAKAIHYKDSVGARCSMTSHLAANRDMILDLMRKQQTMISAQSSDDFPSRGDVL